MKQCLNILFGGIYFMWLLLPKSLLFSHEHYENWILASSSKDSWNSYFLAQSRQFTGKDFFKLFFSQTRHKLESTLNFLEFLEAESSSYSNIKATQEEHDRVVADRWRFQTSSCWGKGPKSSVSWVSEDKVTMENMVPSLFTVLFQMQCLWSPEDSCLLSVTLWAKHQCLWKSHFMTQINIMKTRYAQTQGTTRL